VWLAKHSAILAGATNATTWTDGQSAKDAIMTALCNIQSFDSGMHHKECIAPNVDISHHKTSWKILSHVSCFIHGSC